MASETRRFKLTMFDSPRDSLDFRSYKFTKADRVLLDRLLTEAVERHHHTGDPGASNETVPPLGPLVTVRATGGAIPASTTAYYRVAVVDTKGQEHLASRVTPAPTAPPVLAPFPPLLQRSVGPGTLLPGDYLYAVSAYTHDTSQETEASSPASTGLDGIGSVSLFPPAPPSGSDGFNIYRKGPTDSELHYLTSVARDTPAFVDSGAVTPNSLRTAPTANTTNGHSSILVDLTDGVPATQTVKIYRTFNPSLWDNSLLAWTAVLPVIDSGQATKEGAPPSTSGAVGGPPKINLGPETEGSLPPALAPTHTAIDFSFLGPVAAGISPWQWVNEFDDARLISISAHLGRASTPAAQPVIVALDRQAAGTTTWSRYPVTAEVPIGAGAGTEVAFPAATTIEPGDALRAVTLQTGGGATPTDYDLAVSVLLAVRHGSTTTTYTWET